MSQYSLDEKRLEEWMQENTTSEGLFIVRRSNWFENDKPVERIVVRIVGDPDPPPQPKPQPHPRPKGFTLEAREKAIQKLKDTGHKVIDELGLAPRRMFRRVRQMHKIDRELVEALASARFLSKRSAGISGRRSDGSDCSVENDINATGAEYFAAQEYGQPFDATVGKKGDGGSDFTLPLSIEVVWLGLRKDGKPRETGHLIINPDEPQRWADIYIVVKGSVEDGFEEVGWIPHTALVDFPKKDFGFGEKFACDISMLKAPKLLKALKK